METNRRKIVARLQREGWEGKAGGMHDIFRHKLKPGRIVIPRHGDLSTGVAREIAKIAGWA